MNNSYTFLLALIFFFIINILLGFLFADKDVIYESQRLKEENIQLEDKVYQIINYEPGDTY